jgi:transposase-like protein
VPRDNFLFPLSPRMVRDVLAARGIVIGHEIFALWPRRIISVCIEMLDC